MEKVFSLIYDFSGINPALQSRIISSLIIFFILWLMRYISFRIVYNKTEDAGTRYRWRKWLTYTAVFLGFLLIGRIWFVGFGSFATYLGLLSAGLAIALKDLVASLAGWMFILWRNPISVGDRIQIGDFKGDVIDIRLFKFTLLEIGNWVDSDQSTGRMIQVPNSIILSDPLANYSQGFQFIWHEIPVLVTFESDWRKAKNILNEIALRHALHLTEAAEKTIKQASKKFMIFYNNLKPTVYTTVKDSGVLLTMRYLISPKNRRSSEQEMWEDILDEFAQCTDIDFAYPTTRFYNNLNEGKPGQQSGGEHLDD